MTVLVDNSKPLGDTIVRPMTRADLNSVVEAHLESFPGFFLTFLGGDFLRLLYEGILTDPNGVVLVAARGNEIDGFVAGVTHQSGFYRRLINKKKGAFALASLRAFVTRPSIAPRLIRALRRPKESASSSAQACLMSIGVRSIARGKGVGGSLVKAFCREMIHRQVFSICLMTDRDNNEAANQFYRGLNFQLSGTFTTPEGRTINEYLIELDQGTPHSCDSDYAGVILPRQNDVEPSHT